MAWDLAVSLENRPGTLAEMGEALGGAGVNVDGVCGVAGDDSGTVHILVPDGKSAHDALSAAGISATQPREVIAVAAENLPGELGRLASKVASAGANIDLIYVTMDGRVVLGVDDMEAANQALGQ